MSFDFNKIKKYSGYITGDGQIRKDPNSTRRYTDFIACGSGVYLKYMGETDHENVCAISAYDSDYNVIDYVAGNSERAVKTYYNYTTPENCRYVIISYMNGSKPGNLKFVDTSESYTYNYLNYIFNDYNEKINSISNVLNTHGLLYNEIMNLDDIKNNKKYYAGGYEQYNDENLIDNLDSMCGTIDVSNYVGCNLIIIRDRSNYNNKSNRYTCFYDNENNITDSVAELDLDWYINPSNTLMYSELKVTDKNLFISIRKTSVFYVLIKDKHKEIDYSLKNIFVSPNGDDTNNGLTVNTPLKTINEALKRNAENIQLLSGIYYEQINLSNAKNKNINISNYVTTGHVVIKDPHACISTTETKVNGYTNVYSCPFAYGENGISNDNTWLYQENVNDETTLIPSSEVHPLQRGYFYRCRDTKIYRTSSTELLDALNEIDNSDVYKWFHDNTNHILYFSRPHDVDEDHPIATSFAYKLFTGNTRNYTINMSGIEVKYFIFNLENTLNSTITDCKSSNVFGMGAFTYNNCLNIKFIRCEAVSCITGRNGDGFNGHGTVSSDDIFNKNITATFIDCYAHDNNDDGYSDHEKSETTIIGGLFEYNGKAGITPAQGSHCTCYNVYSRKNCNGFMYINQVNNNEGGNGGQLICYNCYAENNNRSDKTWDHGMGYVVYNANNKIICINCVSEGHETGYTANNNTNMTLINCTSINDTNVKTGSEYMTIKNGTIVS